MAQHPVIRDATREDVKEIHAMIMELATFENAADKVQTNEETLATSLTFAPSASDPNPHTGFARTLLLVFPASGATPEKVIGMALYFYNYSTWRGPGVYLEDLFVRPDYRRRGYAGLLLNRLGQEAMSLSKGKGRLEWVVLKWNSGALSFYEGIGGERMDDWVAVRVEDDRLRRLAALPN